MKSILISNKMASEIQTQVNDCIGKALTRNLRSHLERSLDSILRRYDMEDIYSRVRKGENPDCLHICFYNISNGERIELIYESKCTGKNHEINTEQTNATNRKENVSVDEEKNNRSPGQCRIETEPNILQLAMSLHMYNQGSYPEMDEPGITYRALKNVLEYWKGPNDEFDRYVAGLIATTVKEYEEKQKEKEEQSMMQQDTDSAKVSAPQAVILEDSKHIDMTDGGYILTVILPGQWEYRSQERAVVVHEGATDVVKPCWIDAVEHHPMKDVPVPDRALFTFQEKYESFKEILQKMWNNVDDDTVLTVIRFHVSEDDVDDLIY